MTLCDKFSANSQAAHVIPDGYKYENRDFTRSHRTANAARPCRRGDRIGMRFAAVHESACGTNRTSLHVRSMVAIGGKADMAWTAHFGSD